MSLDPKLLAQEGNGAVEVDEAVYSKPPPIITLVGPIKIWWSEWNSPRHEAYTVWRDAVRVALVKAGCLVYSPHRAIQGSWHPRIQLVNNSAIAISDAIVVLTPPAVEAEGTDEEIQFATDAGVRRIYAPPGGEKQIEDLLMMIAALPTKW